MSMHRWGASFSKSACTHKTTKAALTQLTQSLSEELKEAGLGHHHLDRSIEQLLGVNNPASKQGEAFSVGSEETALADAQ